MVNPFSGYGKQPSLVEKTAGETLTRTVPNSGSVLKYELLSKKPDGTVVVRPIVPEGYPPQAPFQTHISKFDK